MMSWLILLNHIGLDAGRLGMWWFLKIFVPSHFFIESRKYLIFYFNEN